MAHPSIPPPLPFPVFPSIYDAATRWPQWTRSFKLYLTASNVTDDDRQRGLLQYLGGEDLQQLVPTLSGTGTTLDDLTKAIQEEFDKHQNPTLLRYKFRQLQQRPDEGMEEFATRLKESVKRCGFPDDAARQMAVLDQIIIGGKSEALRRKLLETDSIDVEKAIKAARAYEASLSHTQAFRDTQAFTTGIAAAQASVEHTYQQPQSQACAALHTSQPVRTAARNPTSTGMSSHARAQQQHNPARTGRSTVLANEIGNLWCFTYSSGIWRPIFINFGS